MLPLHHERPQAQLVIKRFEKKNESSPNQGKKVLRPDEGQDKKEETSNDEGKIPAVGTTDRLDPPFGEETIRFQELHSFEKAWQYGCIADRIASPPLHYVLGYQNIVPVVQNQVEQFKDEPETDRPGKKKEKLPGMAGKEGRSFTLIHKSVYKQDVRPPG